MDESGGRKQGGGWHKPIDDEAKGLFLAALKRGLSALPVVVPSEETWRLIEGWIGPAADGGQRFGVTDLLIAGLAAEISALVWSLDGDFRRMESIGLARLSDN